MKKWINLPVLALMLALVTSGVQGDTGAGDEKQVFADWLTGTWENDSSRTLEHINEMLQGEDLDRETHASLHLARRITQGSDLDFRFREDSTATLSGKFGEGQLEERGQWEILSVSDDRARLRLSGGDQILNREAVFVRESEDTFYMIGAGKSHTYYNRKQ